MDFFKTVSDIPSVKQLYQELYSLHCNFNKFASMKHNVFNK